MIIVPKPPKPGTPEWQVLITASKIAGILGVSPWASPYSTYVDMTQGRPQDKPSAAMVRGEMLENGIIDWFAHDHPELIELARQLAVTQPDMPWALATLDALFEHADTGEQVLVEVKTASRLDDWRTEGSGLQVPAYYEAQVRFQLALTDTASYAVVVLLTPGLEKVELRIDRDDDLDGAMLDAAHAWQAMLEAGTAPELDDHTATYEAVRREHPEIDADAVAEIDRDLARDWLTARELVKVHESSERGLKTQLLAAMGRAKTASAGGLTIATRTPGARGSVSLRAAATLTDFEQIMETAK